MENWRATFVFEARHKELPFPWEIASRRCNEDYSNKPRRKIIIAQIKFFRPFFAPAAIDVSRKKRLRDSISMLLRQPVNSRHLSH